METAAKAPVMPSISRRDIFFVNMVLLLDLSC
jgi:hypothetical protein